MKWRRRYEVEAQQRRKEYAIAQETIQKLRTEVQQLCQLGGSTLALSPSSGPASLQVALDAAEAERDRLAQALAEEQAAHSRTRENLISALSDAIGSGQPNSPSPAALPEADS